MADSQEQTRGSFYRLRHSVELKLYISFFLSSWGDRMWAFALSIALGTIGDQNMQLTAISGLVNSVTVLFLGASVGRWIDKNARLKAASTILIINNVSVFLSAAILFSILYIDKVSLIWNGGLQTLLICLSIGLCAVSILASMGTKICMTKDWIVVISGSDKNKLANINAWMLRLNLTSLVLSPLIAGQIMASFGQASGCFFLAVWNLFSFGIEYVLLRVVYNSCPALAIKVQFEPGVQGLDQEDVQLEQLTLTTEEQVVANDSQHENVASSHEIASENSGCCATAKKHITSAASGWKTYFQQSIFPASFSLALLYLTVLGFDGITTVYVYSQGIKENLVALCQGVGAIFGITGSFAYPYLRKRIGVERTGLYALSSQITFNTLALISIWLPGSPFDPSAYFNPNANQNPKSNSSAISYIFVNESFTNANESSANFFLTTDQSNSKCSISAFLLGIVMARFGLWLADLAIGQIMQENVADHERGVVNGVQSSLNMTLNMVKDILVISLPDPSTFGILIVISYCSVSSGLISYSMYSRKIRGHVMPFHNQFKFICTKCASETSQMESDIDENIGEVRTVDKF